jgi:hypothetical protein
VEINDELIWDLMEIEAPDKFYIDDHDKPAFLMFPKYHHFSPWKGYVTLWMNRVGLIGKYKSKREALEKIHEIVGKASKPIRLYRVSSYGRNRGKRILFASKDGEVN